MAVSADKLRLGVKTVKCMPLRFAVLLLQSMQLGQSSSVHVRAHLSQLEHAAEPLDSGDRRTG